MRGFGLAVAATFLMTAVSPAAAAVATFESFVPPDYVGSTPITTPLNDSGLIFYATLTPSALVSEPTGEVGVNNTYITGWIMTWQPDTTELCCLIKLKSFDLKAARAEDVGKAFRFGFGFLPPFSLVATADWVTYTFDDLGMVRGSVVEEKGSINNRSLFAMDNFVFEQVAGVPEPATWALMILGFGAAGQALRNHRRTAKA